MDRLFIHSVRKCFQLLECMSQAQRPLGFTELVQLSGLEKSAVQRLAHTLCILGYVRQNPQTRAYALSPRLLEFSHAVLQVDELAEVAEPFLRRLNQECKETVNLMERDGAEIVYVLRYPSEHPVSVDLHVGSRLPVFCTAAGRALLAHMPPEDVDPILQGPRAPMTDRTVTDLSRLQELLAQIRREGFSLNDQEAFIGDISIAAPVFDRHQAVVGAINIAVPFPRWTVDRARRELAPRVRETAHQITRSLTGAA